VSRKQRPYIPRRHSFTLGDEKKFKGYLTETDIDELYDATKEQAEPKLFGVGSGASHKMLITASLPKDFFSDLVEHSATLVPVEEGHPDLERDDILSDVDLDYEDFDHKEPDLQKIWNITEAKSQSRRESEAVKPTSILRTETTGPGIRRKTEPPPLPVQIPKVVIHQPPNEDTIEPPEWIPENAYSHNEPARNRARSDATKIKSKSSRNTQKKKTLKF